MSSTIKLALDTLRAELKRGEDIYESPVLIRNVFIEHGGQSALCGSEDAINRIIDSIPDGTELELVLEFFKLSTMYANDGGEGIRALAQSWISSLNTYKKHLSVNRAEICLC